MIINIFNIAKLNSQIQMENSNNILFNGISLPKCPFLWNYPNQFIHPIIEYYQTDFTNDLDNIISNITNESDKDKIKKFKKDYFEIKQKILLDKSMCDKINLSFHSWYFSKISKSDDMTKIEFNIPLDTCIVHGSNVFGPTYIKQDEILINEFTKRKIRIHDKKLSPANSNTFCIQNIKENNLENNQIDFYSICFDTKIKRCVITHHIMMFD
jgi:hypothetical protein